MSNPPQVNHQDIKAIFATHRRKLLLRVIAAAIIVILSALLSFATIKSFNQPDWIALIIATGLGGIILNLFQPQVLIRSLQIYKDIDLIEEKLKSDSRLATIILSDDSLKEDPRFKYIQSQLVYIIKNDTKQAFSVEFKKTPFIIFVALLFCFVFFNNYQNQNFIDNFNQKSAVISDPQIQLLQQISQDKQVPSEVRSAIESVIKTVENSDYQQTGKLSTESIDAVQDAQNTIEQYEKKLQDNKKTPQQPTATPTITPSATSKDSKSDDNTKDSSSSENQDNKKQQNKEGSDNKQEQGDSKENNKDKQSQSNSDQQQNSNQGGSDQNKPNQGSNNSAGQQNDQQQKGNQPDNKAQDNQNQSDQQNNQSQNSSDSKESEGKQSNSDQKNQKQNQGQKSESDSNSKPDQSQPADKQGISQKLSEAKKSLNQLKDKTDKNKPNDQTKQDPQSDTKDSKNTKNKDSKSGDKSGTGQSKNNDKQLSLTGESDKDSENGLSPKKIEEKKLGNPDEKTDTRFTGNDAKVAENKEPAKLKTELGYFDKLTEQDITDSRADRIPLEYKEFLEQK